MTQNKNKNKKTIKKIIKTTIKTIQTIPKIIDYILRNTVRIIIITVTAILLYGLYQILTF